MSVSQLLKTALPLVAALPLAYAQSTTRVNGATAAITTGGSTTQSGEITIHTITVGKQKDTFIPNSIQANPGDIVSFEFWPSNHSVIRSEYGYPCIPYEDIESSSTYSGFYSGFQPVANETSVRLTTWNLTVNDTSPIWFYCGAPGSCIGWGMLGAINVVNQSEIATQIALARKANYMIEPGEPLPAEVSASVASLASTATRTVTVSATPSSASSTTSALVTPTAASSDHHDHHSSSLSAGAIAGIAIGAALVLILAAGLFFLLGRTKTLADALRGKHNNNSNNDNNAGNNNQTQPPNGQPQMTYPNHHNSMLPPYAQHVHDYKPAGSVTAEEAQIHDLASMRSFSPPLNSAYTSYQQYPPQSPPLGAHQYSR
ncbi:hypothetical protein K431DRAFT_234530 [Polychaeton citri CBS 116435]|uniref:Cupredoxin n=1 Tax=Polychaeton citri CBS 116435 TaxID=1314669 RepID=A0A9P4PZV1_9PEZI|nr:hypothetical protein K431DRAFT_234530 [Polychaeton citri CBS 116435]